MHTVVSSAEAFHWVGSNPGVAFNRAFWAQQEGKVRSHAVGINLSAHRNTVLNPSHGDTTGMYRLGFINEGLRRNLKIEENIDYTCVYFQRCMLFPPG